MILILVLIIPLAGGLLAWATGRRGRLLPWLIALASLGVDLAVLLSMVIPSPVIFSTVPAMLERSTALEGAVAGSPPYFLEMTLPWIPEIGLSFSLALDGLSVVLCALTLSLGLIAVLASWKELGERPGFFLFNLLAVLVGILGVFLSTDLLLFFFFWELMLVPMYLMINIWGHEQRGRASMKFFIFTQASGLLMLLAILSLSILNAGTAGQHTFDYRLLSGAALPYRASLLCMLGFGIAFGVKLPSVPLHTWLPDAHTEAPTAGSVILAGLLLKTGAYGFLRFVLFLFPGLSREFSPVAMALGAASIIYGTLLTFAQKDFKRLVAYSSISHMGFVLLGIFAGNTEGLLGAVLLMVSHGVSSGALFIISGFLQERLGTRDMERMGGLFQFLPRLSGAGILFTLAAVGLPGMGNFAGELLVLIGSAQVSLPITAISACGIILSIIYGLRMVQMVYFGQREEGVDLKVLSLRDLNLREFIVLALLAIAILWLGIHPQPVLDSVRTSLYPVRAAEERSTADLALKTAPVSHASLTGGAR